MNKLLSWFRKSPTRHESALIGYCYVPNESHEPIRNAHVGAVVENPSEGPPWIVVDQSLDSLVVSRWPGRLWKLEVVRPAKEQPNASATYVRAVSVRVLEEVPVSTLFGEHGQEVAKVIESARLLDIQCSRRLGATFDTRALEMYSEAWNRWLSELCRADPNHERDDHSETLAISGASKRSPVGVAPTVLYSVLRERVKTIVGDSAFVVDEEGNESFSPEWSNVLSAFLCAVMGFGVDGMMSPQEKSILIAAWRSTFPDVVQ